jgi:peptide/nickel transport system substrate-binding protein
MEPPVPEEGGTLIRRLTQDVNTLNLLLETLESEKMILSCVYDPLIDIDEKMKLIPGLAERWEVSPDGRTYTFFLNKNATWSDGKPVLASDVVFTLKKIVDPATQSSQFAGLFEGLNQQQTRALDASTAQVVFDQVRASQLVAFNIGILPEHVYKNGSMTRDHNWKAIGSGPYVLSRREAGKEVLLTRRADYWRTKPHIERILFKVLPDDTVAWNAMKSGEIDETQVRSDFWKLERNEPQVRQTMEIHRFYSLGYNFIGWNNKDPILSDKNVRRAMTMSFDRRKIINNLYYGTARMISGPFTPDHWAYNPDVKAIEFDLRAARAVLESAGWTDSNQDGFLDKDGRKMEIELLFRAGNTPSVQQGQVFQNDLKAIGVTLKLTPLDDASLIPKVLSGQYQGVFLGWNLDLDPDLYSLFHSTQWSPKGQNFVFYSNPEVDQLIEQGRIEMNDQKRVEIYHRLHAILAEDQPYTWTFQVSDKWGVNRRVKNVRAVDGLGLFWWYPDSLEWWIPRAHQRSEAPASEPR